MPSNRRRRQEAGGAGRGYRAGGEKEGGGTSGGAESCRRALGRTGETRGTHPAAGRPRPPLAAVAPGRLPEVRAAPPGTCRRVARVAGRAGGLGPGSELRAEPTRCIWTAVAKGRPVSQGSRLGLPQEPAFALCSFLSTSCFFFFRLYFRYPFCSRPFPSSLAEKFGVVVLVLSERQPRETGASTVVGSESSDKLSIENTTSSAYGSCTR